MIKKLCLILLFIMASLGMANAQEPVDLKAMLSGDSCVGLCFLDIENGVTTLDEVKTILQDLNIPYEISDIGSSGYVKWVSFVPTTYPDYVSSAALGTESTVWEMRISTQNVTIDDVVANFGLPSFVSEGSDWQVMTYLPEEIKFSIDRPTGDVSQIVLRNRYSFVDQDNEYACTSNTLACALSTNPIPIIVGQAVYDGYAKSISTVDTMYFYQGFPDDAYLEITTFPFNVGSVRLTLDGQEFIDDTPPFELPLPTLGFYDILVEFFVDGNTQGEADDTRHLLLYLSDSDEPIYVEKTVLTNDEGVFADPIRNDMIYTLSPEQLASTVLEASQTSDLVSSIEFEVNGTITVDNNPPYQVPIHEAGEFIVKLIPFTEDNGEGTAGYPDVWLVRLSTSELSDVFED